ncbi:hypothetical protein BY996DRAFT_4590192 [Phakopsora pachyrhizi]|nr:hypothetical protein BY996DRAFT_4590192 [Phakopsora pachyrhizi]
MSNQSTNQITTTSDLKPHQPVTIETSTQISNSPYQLNHTNQSGKHHTPHQPDKLHESEEVEILSDDEGRSPGRRVLDLSTDLSSDLSPVPGPSTMNSQEQDRVVWVDIASVESDETYWWPGLVLSQMDGVEGDGGSGGGGDDDDRMVKLIGPNNRFIGSRQRRFNSFKATKEFKPLISFVPSKLNPILKVSRSPSEPARYPSAHSLKLAYNQACESYVILQFKESDGLPDSWTCMVPLSQESRSVLCDALSQELPCGRASNQSPIPSDFKDQEETLSEDEFDLQSQRDTPDQEIQIPGEAVLSRDKWKGEYWPATVVGYAGLRLCPLRGRKSERRRVEEKIYRLRFCDGKELEVRRSYFFTSDQEEFYTVEVSRLHSTNISFKAMLLKIDAQLYRTDEIMKGQSKDPDLILKHDSFLNCTKSRAKIPQDVRYGHYSEETIQKIGDYLAERYMTATVSFYFVDSRFSKLNESQRRQYIFDILVPEIVWLVTVEEYMEEAEGQLPKGSDQEEVRDLAKRLAAEELKRIDVVDRVTAMRVRNKRSGERQDDSLQEDEVNDQDGVLGNGQTRSRKRTKPGMK